MIKAKNQNFINSYSDFLVWETVKVMFDEDYLKNFPIKVRPINRDISF